MDVRLLPLNSFIGLVSPPSTSWPNPLYGVGYELAALELPLDAALGKVVADAVAFNAELNRFLLVEVKSGRSIRSEQAARYRHVDGQQLVQHTGVTVASEDDLTVEPLYICMADNVQCILQVLQAAGCAYPVLAVAEHEISLHGDLHSCPELAHLFSEPISTYSWPPIMIRVDEESELAEFNKIASQALITETNLRVEPHLGRNWISIRDLASRAIPHLHIYGTKYRNNLTQKMEQAVRQLCEASPANFRFHGRTASRDYSLVEILDSPEQADPRGRTQRYQATARRLRGPRAPGPDSAQQQALFDSVDLGYELEEPYTSETGTARGWPAGGVTASDASTPYTSETGTARGRDEGGGA